MERQPRRQPAGDKEPEEKARKKEWAGMDEGQKAGLS